VDRYAHEFIEQSAIAWFRNYLDQVKSTARWYAPGAAMPLSVRAHWSRRDV
jgi:hypothetical protein